MTSAPADLRWGIIGAGVIAHHFAADLAMLPGQSVVAVTSRSGSTAHALASSHPGAKAHATIRALVDDDAVDVVYVATPPTFHADHAVAALAAGKHVLVEKPFATDGRAARRIVDAARVHDRFCMEAMWMRFVPAIQAARSAMASGQLGTITAFVADFSYAVTPDPAHHLFDAARGGGALLDRGIYGISLASFLLGPIAGAHGQATIGPTGVDETSTVVLRHRNGALSSLTQSIRGRGTNEARIVGTKATLTLHAPFFGASRLTVVPSGEVTLQPTGTTGTTGAAPQPSADSRGLRARLRSNPVAQRAKGVVDAAVQNARAQAHPYAGHGLAMEAAAAARCIAAGRHESDVMPLDESVAIIEALDSARSSWV